MSNRNFRFRVEVDAGPDSPDEATRVVTADGFREEGRWLKFSRNLPTGGSSEYWRVSLDRVISMETQRND